MTQLSDMEVFDLVRRNYSEANKEYIREQTRIASEYLTKKTEAELQHKGAQSVI